MYTKLYLNELQLGLQNNKSLMDKLNNKRIVITGASGVIGRQLTDLLLMYNKLFDANIKIVAVGRDKHKLSDMFIYFKDKNLTVYNYNDLLISKDNIDYIIHLASFTDSKTFIENPIGVLEESYSLTKSMLDFAVLKNVQMFNYVSSVEVYGKPYTNQDKFTEDSHGEILTTSIRNSYPEAKRFCENLTFAYYKQKNLDIVISRPTKVFSSVLRLDDKRVFVDFASKVVNHKNIVLKSKGSQVFTYIYGLDVVIGLLYVTLCGNVGEAYNIGSEIVASINEVANEFAKQGNVSVEYQIEDDSKTGYINVGHWILDNNKLYGLGFKPIFDLKIGIQNIIKQYSLLLNNKD